MHADCRPIADQISCWMCGGDWQDRAAPREKVIGSNFTGQNRVRSPLSQWVCEPCVYLCSRTSPVPGRPPKEGKQVGGNFRNYSHCWWQDTDGAVEYINASKGEKPQLLAWLRKPKPGRWWATIADSGQKHMLQWGIVCSKQPGKVLFDETIVLIGDWQMVDDMCSVLTAGATKDELQSGDYQTGSIIRCRDAILQFEQQWGIRHRGGAWFALCLWLAQRDEEQVAIRIAAEKEAKKNGTRRQKTGDNQAAGVLENAVSSNTELLSDEALGTASHEKQGSIKDERESGRMADIDVPNAADRHSRQLDFFGSLGLTESAPKLKRRR